jgi:hypothetical protein
MRVESTADGALIMGSGRWVEVEPRLFQWHDGGPFYRGFRAGDDGRMSHLFLGPGSMERIPMRESRMANLIAGLTFILSFVAALLAWPVHVLSPRRRGSTAKRNPWALPALSSAAALNLLFLAGFLAVFFFTDFQRFYKGVPATLAMVLALPVLAIPFTAAATWFAVTAWRKRAGTVRGRISYSLAALTLLLFLAFLAQWNLLGWQY